MSETEELGTGGLADTLELTDATIVTAEASALPSSALPRPRTRWAAIIWGLVLAGIAVAALWVLLAPGRRAGVSDWIMQLSPVSVVSYAILAMGCLLLVTGLVGLARRAQLRLTARG